MEELPKIKAEEQLDLINNTVLGNSVSVKKSKYDSFTKQLAREAYPNRKPKKASVEEMQSLGFEVIKS